MGHEQVERLREVAQPGFWIDRSERELDFRNPNARQVTTCYSRSIDFRIGIPPPCPAIIERTIDTCTAITERRIARPYIDQRMPIAIGVGDVITIIDLDRAKL